MSSVSDSEIAVDVCAQESIRIPGGIQPHGALLVLAPDTLDILQFSVNSAAVLGCTGDALQRSLAQVCGDELADHVRRWVASSDPGFLRTAEINARTLQVLGHRTRQGLIVEFEEPPRTEGETLEALYPRIGQFMESVQDALTLEDTCVMAAREFRRISRFNRVLIYRFAPDWSGEVLAEDGDGVLPAYQGLRFPASDIPAQARELYRLNRLRIIPDARYTPVPLQPALSPLDNQPLDLSGAALRSVSPVHLEYMRNMGTLASMSVSVLVDGRLWGLISCHNATPLRVNAQVRTACDLLGKVVSHQIGARERGAYAARRIELKQYEGELLAHLTNADSPQRALAQHDRLWLKLGDARGAAIVHEQTVLSVGDAPPAERLRRLAERLSETDVGDVFVTDSLAVQWPEYEDIADLASGVLAISISQLHTSYIFWFRPQVVRTVRWAGDPQKLAAEAGAERLHPRHSFASWAQQVRLRAEPWSRAVIDAVTDFRVAMLNVVLRRAEERAALTSRLQRSNRELESFSYSISHDLRAPFRHIVGYTQLLRDNEQGLSEKALHYLTSINEAASTAGQLVDDLLSFSHLGRTPLMRASVDMNKLIQEVLRTLAPDTRERQIVWQVEALPPTVGDAALLRQALVNLVSNAIKYTRGRVPALIKISGEQSAEQCIYEVRDNGVGFDMRYVHKLFGVFQRLHRMEDFEGTGIGLALTKRIIERHGGWIAAEGEPQRGASFRFGLPVREGATVDG